MNGLKRTRTWPIAHKQTNETTPNAPVIVSVAPVHQNIDHEEESPPKVSDEPPKPTSLPKRNTVFENMTGWLSEILVITVPILFLVLGIVVKQLDGKLVESNPYGNTVIEAAQYGVTIFSFVFNTVVVHTIERTENLLVERGVKLILLEQLMGSGALIDTIKTTYRLWTYKFLALMMIFLWCVSPLGGQAILRVLTTGQQTISSSVPIYYFNTSFLANRSVLSVSDNPTYYIPELNTIYSAALIAPTGIQTSSMDNWGNVKIPMLESLDSNTTDTEGWIPVPTGDVTYSSLVGSPIAGIPSTGRSTFEIISSYFHLNCQQPVLLPLADEYFWSTASEVGLCTQNQSASNFGSSRFVNNTLQAMYSIGSLEVNTWNISFTRNTLNDTESPRQILFQSFLTNGIAATTCALRFSTAESRIACSNQNCSVTHMRAYSAAFPSDFTPLEDCITAKNFYQYFVALSGPHRTIWYNISVPSETEVYLMVGSNPLALGVSTPTLSNISNATGAQMSERLSRLLNTFWTASLATEYIAGGMSKFNFTNGSGELDIHPGNFTNATVEIVQNTYICDNRLLGVMLLSSAILLLVALAGLVLKLMVLAPDVFRRISSLTRDNTYIRIPAGVSTLDGAERARMLKDVVVKLGDVQPNEEVGRIAFASTGKEFIEVGTLKRRRMYLQ